MLIALYRIFTTIRHSVLKKLIDIFCLLINNKFGDLTHPIDQRELIIYLALTIAELNPLTR